MGSKEVHNKKFLLPQSRAKIGAKSKIFQLKILGEGPWLKQNQAIHRGYLYFQLHTIHIHAGYISLGACHYDPFYDV